MVARDNRLFSLDAVDFFCFSFVHSRCVFSVHHVLNCYRNDRLWCYRRAVAFVVQWIKKNRFFLHSTKNTSIIKSEIKGLLHSSVFFSTLETLSYKSFSWNDANTNEYWFTAPTTLALASQGCRLRWFYSNVNIIMIYPHKNRMHIYIHHEQFIYCGCCWRI